MFYQFEWQTKTASKCVDMFKKDEAMHCPGEVSHVDDVQQCKHVSMKSDKCPKWLQLLSVI